LRRSSPRLHQTPWRRDAGAAFPSFSPRKPQTIVGAWQGARPHRDHRYAGNAQRDPESGRGLDNAQPKTDANWAKAIVAGRGVATPDILSAMLLGRYPPKRTFGSSVRTVPAGTNPVPVI